MALHAVLLLLYGLIIIYLPVFDLFFLILVTVADELMETDIGEEQTGLKEAVNVTLSDMDYLKKKVKSEGELNEADQKSKGKSKEKKKSKRENSKVENSETKAVKESSNLETEETQPAEAQNEKGTKLEDFERKSEFTIKLRGIPFHAKKKDIEEFLSPLKIVDIRMPKDSKNRPSGRAYVDLESKECIKEALKRHKDYIKGRYIEVFEDKRREAKKDEVENEPPWMENAKELAENEDLSIAEV